VKRLEPVWCRAWSRWTFGLLSLVSPFAQAGSLEFRSEGFFASPDAEVKFFRETWRHTPHLDVNGKLAISFVGPILHPGYHTLSGGQTAIAVDKGRRQLTESGVIESPATPCRRTFSEYQGGLLMRLDYEGSPAGISEVKARLLFPVEVFANRRVRWTGADIVFPATVPAPNQFYFLNDPHGEANQFRFDLGNGTELGVQFLSPIKSLSLSDCREWNEANYHLVTSFEGHSLLVYLCVLKPQEPFHAVEAPPEAGRPPQARLVGPHAVFAVPNGAQQIAVAKTGRIEVLQTGGSVFALEPPHLNIEGKDLAFSEPAGFEVKGNRVEVVTHVKDRPFRLHQSVEMDNDGWLNVSASFEAIDLAGPSPQTELSLPANRFAGRTIRAADRLLVLPREPSAEAMLFDGWAGKVLDYEFPLDGQSRVSLVCDLKAQTLLRDYRPWGQPAFKIGMVAQKGVLNYRLHFKKQDDAIPSTRTPGNLLAGGASFETGPDGVRPFSCYSWTEKMVEPGIPPVFDTTTAVHGTTSLRLTASDSVKKGNPRGFAFIGAVFNRVELNRDRVYTVSAWMKADRPGLKGTLFCGETTWAGEDWQPFPVTTEWKRYQFSFVPSDLQKSGFYLTWAGLSSDCKEGSLWIDAVQLEEGGLSNFVPSSPVEYGIEATSKEKLFEAGQPCTAVLRVRNNARTPLAASVPYVIKDYWDRPVRSGVIPVNVSAITTAAVPLDLGKLPVGYYRGYLTPPGSAVKELIFGVYQPQPLTPLPDDWPLACHNDPTPLVRKIGFGSVRAFDIFEFSEIAPEKGVFTFERADRMVEQAARCGLTIMPILGDFRWPSYRPQPPIPPYAQASVTHLSGDVRMTWPTTLAWKDYVRALTARYQGKITYWEVFNEPNLSMSAEQYFPYLQSAYEAAKEGNPDCKVVGVCATSDFSGKPGSFTDGVFALGGTRFFDVLSVHLYDNQPPEESLGTGSDKLIRQWRTTLRETQGKDAPVWHTEKSYIARETGYSRKKTNVPLDYCDEPQFLVDTFRQKAEYQIRETLLSAVNGGGRFFWFGAFNYESSFISIRAFQPYGLDHTEFDQSPCPELIAANGLARALDGTSHPFRQLAPGGTAYGCVFTGEKGSVAALWQAKTPSRLVIPVGRTPFVVRNFFGEPLALTPDAKGNLVVELEGAPKYLTLPGLTGEAACTLLAQTRQE
jgi:hypothetical protein